MFAVSVFRPRFAQAPLGSHQERSTDRFLGNRVLGGARRPGHPRLVRGEQVWALAVRVLSLSLIHISEPTRLALI
eukprot:3420678-Alexandrium_andersonii.AAC.1